MSNISNVTKLLALATIIKKEFSEALKPFNITHDEYKVLQILFTQDSLFQREIAELTNKDGAQITRNIDKLVKAGYVERQNVEEDRRAFRIVLTAQAFARQSTLEELEQTINTKLFASIEAYEASMLTALIDKMINSYK
jgi:DNA-binding MarR family transcriptional regulator